MYKRVVNLRDDEGLAKINKSTGEIRELGGGVSGGVFFLRNHYFYKCYKRTHSFLLKNFSAEEKRVIDVMIDTSVAGTNSLVPLNDRMSARKLGVFFGINQRRIKPILAKIRSFGGFASLGDGFWVLNPYICFSGRVIKQEILDLFKDSKICLYFHEDESKKR